MTRTLIACVIVLLCLLAFCAACSTAEDFPPAPRCESGLARPFWIPTKHWECVT